MKIAGIIAEYDPFHNGHAAHIAATRAAGATHIAVVLGGNFTQRGEPAAIPKEIRTRMALRGGADLVLELPLSWSMAPAERFARGGVAILHALGCVDLLSFGSESGDLPRLQRIAAWLDSPDGVAALRRKLDAGVSYAAAWERAVQTVDSTAPVLPNDLLGIEYLRAIRHFGAGMTAFAVRRSGAAHGSDAPDGNIASASFLRQKLAQNGSVAEYIPPACRDLLTDAVKSGKAPFDPAAVSPAVLSCWRSMTAEQIAALPYVSEGLENRFYKAARTADTPEALAAAVAARRYSPARIRRILTAAWLGIRAPLDPLPPYIRVLGMNGRGAEILHRAKPSLPLLSRAAQIRELSPAAQMTYEAECRATDLYGLGLPVVPSCGAEQQWQLIRE